MKILVIYRHDHYAGASHYRTGGCAWEWRMLMHRFVSAAKLIRMNPAFGAVVRLPVRVLRRIAHAPTLFVDAIEKIAIGH
jgi:hypothetical protein